MTMLMNKEIFDKPFGFILSYISVLWKWIISEYANNRNMVHILLPSLLGCVIYFNSMCGDMVHDDIPAILKNPDVNGKNPWYQSFSNDFWGNAMSDITSHKSYRPITTLLFRFNFYVCGGGNENSCSNTWCFHGTNVLLHGCATTLLAYICRQRLKMKIESSYITSLIFAIHPIHTEAVSGLVGCADLLACNLTLASFLAYTRYITSPTSIFWRVISVILAVLAVLSKETGIMAMVINISVAILNYVMENILVASQNKSSKKDSEKVVLNPITSKIRRKKRTAALTRISTDITMLVLVASIRLIIQKSSLPQFSAQDNPAAFHHSASTRILTFLYLPIHNFWLLLCPEKLSYDWQMGSVPLIHISNITNDPTYIVIPLFYGTLLSFILVLLQRLKPQESKSTYQMEEEYNMLIGVLNKFIVKFISIINYLKTSPFKMKKLNDEGSFTLPTSSGQSVSNKCKNKVPVFSNSRNENFAQCVALLFLIFPFLPASNLFFPVGFVIAERILYLPSVGFCILVGLGYERIRQYFARLKLKAGSTKKQQIDYDNVNNDNLKLSGQQQKDKFDLKRSDTSVSIVTSFEAFELSDTDINHNDIIPSTPSQKSSSPIPVNPKTQTSSSSCSWWLLFLVNPSRQKQKPQQKNDSDILLNEPVSHNTFSYDDIKSVSSNTKHPYILKTPHFTQAISAANYQLSISSSNTSTMMCCNEKLNLSALEHGHAARLRTYSETHFEFKKQERKCKDDKSTKVFATKSSSKCVGSVPRNKHHVMKFTKKKVLNKIVYLLSTCFWVVMFLFAIKTWTRNQDWTTRKALFRSGVKTQPTNAKAHYNFANVLREDKKVEEAIKHYKIALKLWPNYVLAHNNLATLLEDKPTAEYHLREALSIDPWHPNSLYNLAVFMSEKGLYEEAILLLEKCITEDYSHERAHTLLSQFLLKKYKSGNKINEDNESRMGKCQKEVKDNKGKCETTKARVRFRATNKKERRQKEIHRRNIVDGIKRKTRNMRAKMNLILSFSTKVSLNKDKKKLGDEVSSFFKSFHFIQRDIMGQTRKNNDVNNRNDNNNNNNQEKKKGKGKNHINCYYDEHDINVTSTTTLTYNNNHNHKTHLKKLDYYTIKKADRVVELNENVKYKTEKVETTILTRYHQLKTNTSKPSGRRSLIKDTTKWKEISLHKELYNSNLTKLFPNQLIQISHLKKKKTSTDEEHDNDISMQSKEGKTNKSTVVKEVQTFNNDILPSIYQQKELHSVDVVNSLLVVEGSKMLQTAKENDANGKADAGHVLQQQLQCTN